MIGTAAGSITTNFDSPVQQPNGDTMPNIGPMEIIVVLIIALVVFGPKRLPELGKSLGRGIQEFKGTISGDHTEKPAAELDKPEPVATHVAVETDAATKSPA
jgi:sec-independent protein translocase protein TatA